MDSNDVIGVQNELQHPGYVKTLQKLNLALRRHVMARARGGFGRAPHSQHLRVTERPTNVLPQVLVGHERSSLPCWWQIDPLRLYAAYSTLTCSRARRLSIVYTRNLPMC